MGKLLVELIPFFVRVDEYPLLFFKSRLRRQSLTLARDKIVWERLRDPERTSFEDIENIDSLLTFSVTIKLYFCDQYYKLVTYCWFPFTLFEIL